MKHLLALFLFIFSTALLNAQSFGGGEANPDLKTNQESLENWENLRFGMFIHWGPVSLRGTEIGWSRGPQVPINEYDQLYKEFNPVLYNAEEWVLAAKNAGMKYLIITTKHHDGFCLWPSEETEYDIASTPYQNDILKPLAEACQKHGILFGTYYSICDWYHPDYTTRYGGDPRPVDESNMSDYINYMYKQLRELTENYNTSIFWFDGYWEDSWDHEKGMDLYKYCRELNPEALVNNRVDIGRKFRDKAFNPKYAGDYATPEQEIGTFNMDIPWESCITIGKQWAWKPNDQVKSTKELIQTLAFTAGGNGNLLLNVGPMMDGRTEQKQINRLAEVGTWLKENGEAIYETQGGPYLPEHWIASTRKGHNIYLHLLKWPELNLTLPRPEITNIKKVELLSGGPLKYTETTKEIIIELPDEAVDPDNTVIKLSLDGSAENLEPLKLPKHDLRTPEGGHILFKENPAARYSGIGAFTLFDENSSSQTYNDGTWLGFEEVDLEVTIDLEKDKKIKYIGARFLQNQSSWIFFPKDISFYGSKDGETFSLIGTTDQSASAVEDSAIRVRTSDLEVDQQVYRYIRIRATNVGNCPPWHIGAGGKAWIFVDEIFIQ